MIRRSPARSALYGLGIVIVLAALGVGIYRGVSRKVDCRASLDTLVSVYGEHEVRVKAAQGRGDSLSTLPVIDKIYDGLEAAVVTQCYDRFLLHNHINPSAPPSAAWQKAYDRVHRR